MIIACGIPRIFLSKVQDFKSMRQFLLKKLKEHTHENLVTISKLLYLWTRNFLEKRFGLAQKTRLQFCRIPMNDDMGNWVVTDMYDGAFTTWLDLHDVRCFVIKTVTNIAMTILSIFLSFFANCYSEKWKWKLTLLVSDPYN